MRGRERSRGRRADEWGGQQRPYQPQYDPERRQENSNTAKDFKIYVGFGVLGIVTSVGVGLLIRHFVKKGRRKTTEVKTTESGQPASFAKLLQMAFQNDNYFGWGTNLPLVYRVFNALPSQAFYKNVQTEYDKMTSGKSLNADLSDELNSEEYDKVLAILNSKKLR
jgi:hypothetical protein